MSSIPDPMFSEAQLGRLQLVDSPIECECSNHLAELVLSLSAFERYSKNCESTSPEDAEVHRLLYEETARARQIMEEALARVCAHENISLDDI